METIYTGSVISSLNDNNIPEGLQSSILKNVGETYKSEDLRDITFAYKTASDYEDPIREYQWSEESGSDRNGLPFERKSQQFLLRYDDGTYKSYGVFFHNGLRHYEISGQEVPQKEFEDSCTIPFETFSLCDQPRKR